MRREYVPGRGVARCASPAHELQPLVGDTERCRDGLTQGIMTVADMGKHAHQAMDQHPRYP